MADGLIKVTLSAVADAFVQGVARIVRAAHRPCEVDDNHVVCRTCGYEPWPCKALRDFEAQSNGGDHG